MALHYREATVTVPRDNAVVPKEGGGWEVKAYSVVGCLGNLITDHAPLFRDVGEHRSYSLKKASPTFWALSRLLLRVYYRT